MFLKFCMYEASVHVPLLVDVPSGAAAVRNELVEHIDLFPTLCELVGADCPGTVQGNSLTPLLDDGPPPDGWRDAVFSQIDDLQMIRTRDWKLNAYGGEPGELYDLRNDPREYQNLIGDAGHADTVESLFRRLKEWEEANRVAG